MSIRFYCPLGHRLKVPDHRVGKKGRCPVCRERVVVPSVSLPRRRPKQPSNGEVVVVVGDQAAAGRPRSFDQLAAEFLTRETEIGIAAKLAAISEQAAKKNAPPLPDVAPSGLEPTPPDLRLPQDEPALPASVAVEATGTGATHAEPPELAARLEIGPIASTSAFEDPALVSFLASAAPAMAAATDPVSSPAPAPPVAAVPPPLPAPPPPPLLPPLSARAAPPRAAIATPAMLGTTWWAWATRDTIGQYPIHRATVAQLEVVYWLASLLPFAIVLCAAPAVSHLRLNTAPAWAQAMLLLAGAQLAYAVWLALLPDYSTLRVGMLLFSASAGVYGLAVVISLSKPAWLDLSSGGSAAVWCGGCLAATVGLSYACAKIGSRWLRL